MKIQSILSAPALLLLSGSALALDKSVEFATPEGATSYTYKTIDGDGWFNPNDTLETGTHPLENVGPGETTNIDFKDLFCNDDGHVEGPEGSSGESDPNVFVEITFHFPGGATVSATSEKVKLDCDEDAEPQQARGVLSEVQSN